MERSTFWVEKMDGTTFMTPLSATAQRPTPGLMLERCSLAALGCHALPSGLVRENDSIFIKHFFLWVLV